MTGLVLVIILGALFLLCIVLGLMQLKEKGPLLNNAYLYSTKEQREQMDKKPYYRQSGIVFLMIAPIFAMSALDVFLQTDWILKVILFNAVIALIYSIRSSLRIANNE